MSLENIETILPKLEADGIYGQINDYGEQKMEMETRQQVASLSFDSILNEVSNYHSIPVMDYEIKKFLKFIPENGIILDLGGCWGWHWRNLNKIRPDIKVILVDLIRDNLKIAKKFLDISSQSNIYLYHGNANNLSLDNNIIDAVWSVQATQHIPTVEKVYQEIYIKY